MVKLSCLRKCCGRGIYTSNEGIAGVVMVHFIECCGRGIYTSNEGIAGVVMVHFIECCGPAEIDNIEFLPNLESLAHFCYHVINTSGRYFLCNNGNKGVTSTMAL